MSRIHQLVYKDVLIAPLITFRVLFGLVMALSILRFAYYGWIYDLYIEPTYYFTYYGFGWVKSLGDPGMYFLFVGLFVSAIGIMLGAYYRVSALFFFLCFSYVELIDKTNYLNHYYFVSLISFLLILVPAHKRYSLDAARYPSIRATHIPAWCINIFKLQLIFVYFFAGVAKLNYSWLIEAMPLKLWLPAKTHIPILGELMQYEFMAYAFSWTGAIYDLSIAFLLLWPKSRNYAFAAVVVFHLLTAIFFQIGVFPYVMIASSLIFFSGNAHTSLQSLSKRRAGLPSSQVERKRAAVRIPKFLLVSFFAIQVLIPFRYLAYPGSLYWTEQGYRFSWRVMLMEKAGHTTFRIEGEDGKKEWVQNYDHLTPQQEKMMATQPDMILQYAHYLGSQYQERGFLNPSVYCDSQVTLNGRRSKEFIDPKVDLCKIKRGFKHKSWIKTNRSD